MSEKLKIEFTRACARSESIVIVNAVQEISDTYDPDCRIYRFEHDGKVGEQWYYDNFNFHMQDITLFRNPDIDAATDYLTYMSSEGDVYHAWREGNFREKIKGAGTWVDDAKGYGRLFAISQIGNRLYAAGDGGQFYMRYGRDDWRFVTESLLFDPVKYREQRKNRPKTDDPDYLSWLMESKKSKPRNVLFNGIKGIDEDAIYLCGEEGIKPILCFWNGDTLHELNTQLSEAALTGIYIENSDSIWICGREGVLLHGSYARGFTPVSLRPQHNLFHMITPYRGKLVLPSSTRPGELFEFDPKTSDLKRFSPALPKLRGDYIFYAGAVADVLWVVGQKDIFRFDGAEWERIEHPDL
ncbi:hypothetical protein FBZ98_107141 [Rhizobium sp. ERR 922]|uniref:hypothetical protein n=1 Tax=unclassified Rhizobium TaxID=2613769 RepID=UPI0011A4B747|nr:MULTISPECIES: hypothetical protein [unclassified Rhizobium]TWB49108.1 hypothetical protein FBZ98_107141 [Rhizobium sp. ERR 922]TWB91640.1 hypothetical protein FBZ97_107141 [Rhizobium sp. ERR 942]